MRDALSFSCDSEENNQNKLKEPKIYRLRSDISWANVVSLYNKEHRKDLSGMQIKR